MFTKLYKKPSSFMLMKGHKERKVDTKMEGTLYLCASLDGFIRPLHFRIFIQRVGVSLVPEAEAKE